MSAKTSVKAREFIGVDMLRQAQAQAQALAPARSGSDSGPHTDWRLKVWVVR